MKAVDFRHAPGGMHHQVGFDRVLLRSRASVDEQVVALSFNGGDCPVHVNLDAQFPACLHEQGDKIGVKLLEGTAAAVEHLDLCARTCRDVRELEADAAAADEDDAAWQVLQVQKLCAGGQTIPPTYPQRALPCSRRPHHLTPNPALPP